MKCCADCIASKLIFAENVNVVESNSIEQHTAKILSQYCYVFAELPTGVGAFFEGHVISDTCTKRKPDIISFEIKQVRRDSYFTNTAFVSIQCTLCVSFIATKMYKIQTRTAYSIGS